MGITRPRPDGGVITTSAVNRETLLSKDRAQAKRDNIFSSFLLYEN